MAFCLPALPSEQCILKLHHHCTLTPSLMHFDVSLQGEVRFESYVLTMEQILLGQSES